MNVISKSLACLGVAAIAATGPSLPAQAAPPLVSTVSSAPAPAGVQSITQVKWPTLKKGEAGEMQMRIKPQRGVSLPTAAGISLNIDAPLGASFNNGLVILEDPMSGKKERLNGKLSVDATNLSVTSPSFQATSTYGIRVYFSLLAVTPTEGPQEGKISITGGPAFVVTASSYHYIGAASEQPPAEDPAGERFTIAAIFEDGGGDIPAEDWFDKTSSVPYVGFAGIGTPGATVVLRDASGKTYGQATVQDDGTWSYPPNDYRFPDGTYVITATQTYDGKQRTAETRYTISASQTRFTFPMLNGDMEPQEEYMGVGKPGEHLLLQFMSLSEEIVTTGQTIVNPQGRWTYKPGAPLPYGTYNVRIRHINELGTVSGFQGSVEVTIMDRVDQELSLRVADHETPAEGGDVVLTDPRVYFAGTGTPRSTIKLTDASGREFGFARVRLDGTWQAFHSEAFDNGTHVITATQLDDSETQTSVQMRIIMEFYPTEFTAPTGPCCGPTVVSPTPTFAGKGRPGDEITLSFIRIDTGMVIKTVPGMVRPDGKWEVGLSFEQALDRATYHVELKDGKGALSDSTEIEVRD